MKNYYNLEKLVRIKVFPACKSNYYTYKREIKIFGLILQKQGIYSPFGGYCKMNENHFIKDGEVYENPECSLVFEGGHIQSFCFKTVEEAEVKAKEIKKQSGIWI